MYIPPKFALSEADTRAALARGGFAHLVTHAADGMLVTALPLLYDPNSHSLIGHVARANPHWRAAGAASVAIFAGPHAYISPSFYATKSETGKVVPTWNYEVVHAHGRLVVHDDVEWLRAFVTRLTGHHEAGRPDPWAVTDAPARYIDKQLRAIVGLEVTIEAVEGKAKLSQNRSDDDRAGVVAGLRAEGSGREATVADQMERLQ